MYAIQAKEIINWEPLFFVRPKAELNIALQSVEAWRHFLRISVMVVVLSDDHGPLM